MALEQFRRRESTAIQKKKSQDLSKDNFVVFRHKDIDYRIPKLIENRFEIKTQHDKGSFGTVFDCTDLKTFRQDLIMKITTPKNSLTSKPDYEISIMEHLKRAGCKGFPKIVSHGTIEGRLRYVVMQKYGPSLKFMLKRNKKKRFRIKTVVQIGLQLLDRLEALHKLGYVHLDLKPDNILLGSYNFQRLESSSIYLIDFGISRPYVDQFDEHIPFRNNISFMGNLLFASKNAFLRYEQSRRDDLISMTYLMAFLISGRVSWHGDLDFKDPNYYNDIYNIKTTISVAELCCGPAEALLFPFANEIFNLKFDEKPHYARLRHHLIKILLDNNIGPNSLFDWSRFKLPRQRFSGSSNPEVESPQRKKEDADSEELADVERVPRSSLTQALKDKLQQQLSEIEDNSQHAIRRKSEIIIPNSVTSINIFMVEHTLICNSNKLKKVKRPKRLVTPPKIGKNEVELEVPCFGRARLTSEDNSKHQSSLETPLFGEKNFRERSCSLKNIKRGQKAAVCKQRQQQELELQQMLQSQGSRQESNFHSSNALSGFTFLSKAHNPVSGGSNNMLASQRQSSNFDPPDFPEQIN